MRTYMLDEEEVTSNPFLGIIGALLGALAGAVMWFVLYQIGIIASIAGVAIVALACKGYARFSRKLDVKGAVIAVFIATLVLIAVHIFCWGYAIYNAGYATTLFGAILAIPEVVLAGDMTLDFVKELMMGFVLMGVGGIPYLKKTLHERKIRIEREMRL